jgi:Coenzyme PQQ synthesis protein D (PqqD)
MSATPNTTEANALLAARVRIPQGVVYRSFVKETVILNLESGLYHGVNPTGGRMLDTLEKVGSVGDAAKILAGDYGLPLAEIESDLCAFCEALVQRGLLVVERA